MNKKQAYLISSVKLIQKIAKKESEWRLFYEMRFQTKYRS